MRLGGERGRGHRSFRVFCGFAVEGWVKDGMR